jgi:hypothetical protein
MKYKGAQQKKKEIEKIEGRGKENYKIRKRRIK